ncbi:DUF7006 family protein [Enterococcus casseliflavus]|uniref:DUF7006 family protein n=1 Tax=Enterococcus casseliflavus TaxID=37734 RepID=UPI0003F84B98|nr:hypothetical protein [Enterococcus casseliflavus]
MYFTTKEDYIKYFSNELQQKRKESQLLEEYLKKQSEYLHQVISEISPETFWQEFPKILGIEARFGLLLELIAFEDFSDEEIIRMIEADYKNYFKELCGYPLSINSLPLMIFNSI